MFRKLAMPNKPVGWAGFFAHAVAYYGSAWAQQRAHPTKRLDSLPLPVISPYQFESHPIAIPYE